MSVTGGVILIMIVEWFLEPIATIVRAWRRSEKVGESAGCDSPGRRTDRHWEGAAPTISNDGEREV